LAKTVPGGSPVIRKVLTRIVLLAVLLEAAQVFIASHACGVLDILVAIAGGLAGMASALLLLRAGVLQAERVGGHRPGPPTLTPPWRAAVQAALVFTIVCVAAPGVWPTGSAMADSGGPDIRWVPFQAHFLEPFPIAAADLLESIGAYTFIALLCLLLTRGSGRLASLMLLMGMIAVVELCPALTASRVADLTPLLLAVVAWLLAGRIWNAIYPPRPPSASATRGEARPRSVTAPGPTRQHRKLTS
jgi:hypothetical protein